MAKKEIKVKGNDGRKELRVVIEDVATAGEDTVPTGSDVEAYQDPASEKSITIIVGTQRLTITIAE